MPSAPGIDPDPGRPRKFAYRPNLVVVDGGLPQVNAAAAVLAELGAGAASGSAPFAQVMRKDAADMAGPGWPDAGPEICPSGEAVPQQQHNP